MRRLLGFLGLLAGFLGFSGAAVYLQSGILNELSKRPVIFRDSLYLPSSQYVKLISLGYDHFASDFLWLRSIQTFGATFANKEHLPLMKSYFDVITDLDPHFIEAYSFGNMAVGEEGGAFESGLQLLDKGIAHNPHDYKLAYEGAFFAFWTMNDAERAKGYVAKAVQAPNCPEFVRGWSAFFDLRLGRYVAAYENYAREYMEFVNTGNEPLSNIRRATLRRAINAWYTAGLREKGAEFWETNGRSPTVKELEEIGAFRDVEWPNWVSLREYLDSVIMQNGRFPETEQERQDLVRFFIKKGWERMPDNPASENRHFPGYMFWHGMEPYVTLDEGSETTATPTLLPGPSGPPAASPEKIRRENFLFAISELDAAHRLTLEFKRIQPAIEFYRQQNDGRCPSSVSEVPARHHLNEALLEPWGGEFIIDPKDCQIRASSFLPHRLEDLIAESPPI